MIQTFKHAGLKRYFETGKPTGSPADMVDRIRFRLNALDRAKDLRDVNLPGFDFHKSHSSHAIIMLAMQNMKGADDGAAAG